MGAFCMDGRHLCGVSAIRELSRGEPIGRRRNNRGVHRAVWKSGDLDKILYVLEAQGRCERRSVGHSGSRR